TMRRAGETPVGDEGDRVAEAVADEGPGDRQHLAHAGAAARALVANDDDVAGLNATGLHGGESRLLSVEDAGEPLVARAAGAGELDHATLGRERPAEDREAAARLERAVAAEHDLLPRRLDGCGGLRRK